MIGSSPSRRPYKTARSTKAHQAPASITNHTKHDGNAYSITYRHILFQFAVQTTNASGQLKTVTSSYDATAAHLKDIIFGFQDGINSRIFDPSAPVWRHLADDFELCPDYPVHFDAANITGQKLPLAANLEVIRQWCEQNREYHVEYDGMTTEVDEARGRATCFTSVKARGAYCSSSRCPLLQEGRMTEPETMQKLTCVSFN